MRFADHNASGTHEGENGDIFGGEFGDTLAH